MSKGLIISFLSVLIIAGGWFGYWQFIANEENQAGSTSQQTETEGFDKTQYSIDEPGSLWWVVNKQRTLPDDYTPANLDSPDIKLRWASDAESMQLSTTIIPSLEQLYRAAKKAGHNLMLVSGYRSAEYQAELFNNYVRSAGEEEAERFSARPGTSEHQTGLVADLGRVDGKCEIDQCFGQTVEGKWLANNAYKFGFIIRYLEGKEDITGYMYEPWHFRYVGNELAEELHNSGQTMEEFFGV